MALSGKYELVKNEGHLEHVLATGLPEDIAKKSAELKSLEISVNGDKVTIDRGDGRPPQAFIVGKETEEKFKDIIIKNTATLNGDVLTIEYSGNDGKWKREYTLKGSELTVVSSHSKPGVPVGKRIFKKL